MTLTRPDLHVAVAGQKSKASDYNDNFDMMLDYCDEAVEEALPSQTGNADKFLKTNGTTASWEKISLGTKFAINKGNPNLLVNNSTSLGFNVSSSNPLTYTDINGNSRTVTSLDDIDVTNVADGTYKVVLPASGNTPMLFNNNVFTQVECPTATARTYDIIGSPTINNGVASNLNNNNYLHLPIFAVKNKNFEIVFKIKTGDSFSTYECIAYTDNTQGIALFIISNKLCFSIGNGKDWVASNIAGNSTISTNTTYYVKLARVGNVFTSYLSTDGVTYNQEATTTNSIEIGSNVLNVGTDRQKSANGVFTGLIYLNESFIKLNGETWWGDYEEIINTGDIWLNPQEPYSAKQYNGNTWDDYNNVILQDSSVTIASGVITAIKQSTYNNNKIKIHSEITEILSLIAPSDVYVDITLLASGSEYEAQANGYFALNGGVSQGGFGYISGETQTISQSYTTSTTIANWVYVSKGDIVTVSYSGFTKNYFRFIYAKGEV